jgi:hypothetical protein
MLLSRFRSHLVGDGFHHTTSHLDQVRPLQGRCWSKYSKCRLQSGSLDEPIGPASGSAPVEQAGRKHRSCDKPSSEAGSKLPPVGAGKHSKADFSKAEQIMDHVIRFRDGNKLVSPHIVQVLSRHLSS